MQIDKEHITKEAKKPSALSLNHTSSPTSDVKNTESPTDCVSENKINPWLANPALVADILIILDTIASVASKSRIQEAR